MSEPGFVELIDGVPVGQEPPQDGDGLVQVCVRVRVWALLHAPAHALHEPHAVQAPFTAAQCISMEMYTS